MGMTLSTANGAIRPTNMMATLDSTGRLPKMNSQMPALMPPPTAAAGADAQTQMSLTAGPDMSILSAAVGSNQSPTSPMLPNAILAGGGSSGSEEDDDDSPTNRPGDLNKSQARGVWFAKSVDVNDMRGSPIAGVVITCGDMRCGQTGLSQADLAKKGHASVHVVEQLRGTMPVQVEA